MCGRFSLTATPEDAAELFGLDELEVFPPRYNIAPTQPILVIAAAPSRAPGSNRSDRTASLARWGLMPSWLKDPKGFPLLINARSETAAGKSAFRAAMRHRRALVPASGFYEWKREARKKSQPYWVRPKGGGIVAFAALWECWIGPDGSEIDTAAILTTRSNGTLAAIHDRMPVVITGEHWSRWLDCRGTEPRDMADLLAPPKPDFFEAIPVSTLVNKVANAGPEVQEPAAEASEPQQIAPSSSGAQMSLL